MKEIGSSSKTWIYDVLIVGLYGGTITFMIKNITYLNDIKIHNLILIDYLEAGYFPIPPGYYGLIFLIDLILRIKYSFVLSSILVITLFMWWKYRLIFSWLQNQIPLSKRTTFLVSLSILFLGPIYLPGVDEGLWYLGKFTPTIWHNSTIIASFPFAIILCLKTLNWIENPRNSQLYILAGLGLILLLIKPSFLFCYIPALPLYILSRDKALSKIFWKSAGLVLLLFVLLMLEKQLIFTWDPMREKLYEPGEISTIVIAPFKIWLHYSHQPVWDMISSISLLLCFLIVWPRSAFQDSFFTFTLLLLIIAFLIYFLFSETGIRQYHANFYWQIPIALLLNYMSIVSLVLKDYQANDRKFTSRTRLIIAAYFIQGFFGLFYWVRIFAFETLI
ncbi:hypothetical protein [Algoriphagus yeomjeoni]|uniref:Mannosyltransferase PIG-V n=1 Tax=Algoriphagus yeomjeoni TaxID=291403 RepID=A0A327P1H3_9BACT|nr:hypothetical protein [Algoriphagus yeomjeoni]RAI85553.1 hypothetical protein LV83_03633 [Algoriphagus yeomjeoni]